MVPNRGSKTLDKAWSSTLDLWKPTPNSFLIEAPSVWLFELFWQSGHSQVTVRSQSGQRSGHSQVMCFVGILRFFNKDIIYSILLIGSNGSPFQKMRKKPWPDCDLTVTWLWPDCDLTVTWPFAASLTPCLQRPLLGGLGARRFIKTQEFYWPRLISSRPDDLCFRMHVLCFRHAQRCFKHVPADLERVYVYVHVYMSIYMDMYMFVSMYVLVSVCVCVGVCACAPSCMYVCWMYVRRLPSVSRQPQQK